MIHRQIGQMTLCRPIETVPRDTQIATASVTKVTMHVIQMPLESFTSVLGIRDCTSEKRHLAEGEATMVGKPLTLKGFYGLSGAAAWGSRPIADFPCLHWPLRKSPTLGAKLPALEIDHRAVARSPKSLVRSASILEKLGLSLGMFGAGLCRERTQRAFWRRCGATERVFHVEARHRRAAVQYVASSS